MGRIGDALSRMRVHDASDGSAGTLPRLDVVAEALGLPEERVAMMIAQVRKNGLDEAQIAPMMQMASSKGLDPELIMQMLTGMGASRARVAELMRAQGILSDEEASRYIDEDERLQTERLAEERRRKRRERLRKALVIAFWILVWQGLDLAMNNRLVLAGPIRVMQALAEGVVEPGFWLSCSASFARIAAGFLLSFFVGISLALLSHHARIVRDFVEPVISLLRTIPVVSIIIMLLIWVGNQMLTVYLSFLIVLPIIYTNMLAGLENVDPRMLEMARCYRLGWWRTFMYVYRPAFMPFLKSSCRLSLGMSWKAGIMAEVLATPKPSIGKEMAQARTFLATPDLFAWTVVVMILSWGFEKAFMALLDALGRPLGSLLGVRDEKEAKVR